MTKTERIENIVKKLKTRKSKNIIYTLIITAVVFCFGFRFYTIAQEGKLSVFNIIRNNQSIGTPVNVMSVEQKNGVLYEPLSIKNNRGYISGSRVNIFKPGQKSGNCKIVSVSKKLDLDTGMYVVKTSGCENGLQYIEKEKIGIYIPVSAIYGKSVYVVNGDVAEIRDVEILDRDIQNALIKSGLQDGDIVILSKVKNNEKVRITK